ncbi:MAG: hypothetical protein AAF213_10760 [Pseudomonadota bacterium]
MVNGANDAVQRQHEQAQQEHAERVAAEKAAKARQGAPVPDEEPAAAMVQGDGVDADLEAPAEPSDGKPSQAAFDEEVNQGRIPDPADSRGPGARDLASESLTPGNDDASLKAKLYRATIAGKDQRGLLTTLDEDEQLENVDVSGPRSEHVTVGFKDKMQVYMGASYKQATNVQTPAQRQRAASMMMDQAKREQWKSVIITGNDDQMKDEMWVQAKMNGLKVKGHKPSKAAKRQYNAMKEMRKDGSFRQGCPFQNGVENEAQNSTVPGAMTRDDGPDNDVSAGGSNPPEPPSGGDGGAGPAEPPKTGPTGGGAAAELPEDEPPAPEAGAGEEPPAADAAEVKTGEVIEAEAVEPAAKAAAPAAAADVIEAEVIEQPGPLGPARPLPAGAAAAAGAAGGVIATADADAEAMISSSPLEVVGVQDGAAPEVDEQTRLIHEHFFGEPTAETRQAFEDAITSSPHYDPDKNNLDDIEASYRDLADQMKREATGASSDAEVMATTPAVANDTGVSNLATGADMVAPSPEGGTEVTNALAVVNGNESVRTVTTEASRAVAKVKDESGAAIARVKNAVAEHQGNSPAAKADEGGPKLLTMADDTGADAADPDAAADLAQDVLAQRAIRRAGALEDKHGAAPKPAAIEDQSTNRRRLGGSPG